jgi:hypothetical protein
MPIAYLDLEMGMGHEQLANAKLYQRASGALSSKY